MAPFIPHFIRGNPVPTNLNETGMTAADWLARGHQQAMAMINGNDWENSSCDKYGDETGGQLNGDYSDETHDALNQRLKDDEYYEAQVDQDLRKLYKAGGYG
jgi:hypothetical protein